MMPISVASRSLLSSCACLPLAGAARGLRCEAVAAGLAGAVAALVVLADEALGNPSTAWVGSLTALSSTIIAPP
ncbi:hypothetical protein, partial [Xanthomonas oryzae]|uniref:hypothetical protein n=1 Tax=Xanthomonas oryzae TaxID=347 RepID=UPI001ED92BDE